MFVYDAPIVTEVAPDVFRFCLYARNANLQFNFFLIRDDEPLLFTTGYRSTFPMLREAVARVIDPSRIRWIGFSHFESDECGALNQWLDAAPHAVPVCSLVSALVNMDDFADRPAKGLQDGEVLETGKYRFQFCATAHLPHGWDAGLLFEETQRTLFCSDLFHQEGNGEPITSADLGERVRTAMSRMQAGPLANYVPYSPRTDAILEKLAALNPKTLASCTARASRETAPAHCGVSTASCATSWAAVWPNQVPGGRKNLKPWRSTHHPWETACHPNNARKC